jgi:hypothetical protein
MRDRDIDAALALMAILLGPEFVKQAEAEFIKERETVEEGWQSLLKEALPDNLPETQARAMRWSFYAGATHLFATIIRCQTPEHLTAIKNELVAFAEEVRAETQRKKKNGK